MVFWKPAVIGIIARGVLLVGGIIWAVLSAPSASGPASNPNLSFNDANDPTLGPSDAKTVVRIFGDRTEYDVTVRQSRTVGKT